MGIQSNRTSSLGSTKKRKKQRQQSRQQAARRELHLERLEERQLLAVLGPKLAGIQPTDGDLLPLDGTGVRHTAPRDLTFRFDQNQQIDPSTLAGVRIFRAGFDGEFANSAIPVQPGYIGVGSAPNENEIIVRFAETLPDDLYRIELQGVDDVLAGIPAIRNTRGEALGDFTADGVDNGSNMRIDFELELGPQVVAVVPQPVTRIPDAASPTGNRLSQARNQIVVYFNDDDLYVKDNADGTPTAGSAENPHFYRLIHTNGTVENTDDVEYFPLDVVYDPVTDSATLTFEKDLEQLSGSGTFRLRVGTNEAIPAAPARSEPVAAVIHQFATGGVPAEIEFQATADFGKAVSVNVTKADLGATAGPSVDLVGNVVNIVLNTNAASVTTAGGLVTAIGSSPAAAMIRATLKSGGGDIATAAPAAESFRLIGLGSSYETATDLGTLTNQSQILSSAIDPQAFALDFPGEDEPGHRDIPNETGSGYEQHVNPSFGPDTTDGVTEIMYNFRQLYGYDASGAPLSNLITAEQKQRVREAVELWGKELGVQFLETADQGLTFVTGDPNALDPNDPNVLDHAINAGASNYDFIVRVDPEFKNGMLILDSDRRWNNDFGGEWFERAMVGIGAMLGLQRANDLPVTNLMAYDTSEPYAGSLGGWFSSATSPEQIYPGNADVIHGQYVHRPDSNDIDLYKFTIDLNDANLDEKKQGIFTAESFAERLPDSSQLDTVLSLYREVPVQDENGQVIGFERELIARNDDYYSSDSYVSLPLGSGTYYIGVTASGNTDFDPVIEDTGLGGVSQGKYDIRLNWRSQVDDEDVISDLDRSDEGRPGTPLDGDADGTPGGVYSFWFQTRPLTRVIEVTAGGNAFVDGQTLTIEDAQGVTRRFEFDSGGGLKNPSAIAIPFTPADQPAATASWLTNSINNAGFGVSASTVPGNPAAVVLNGERVAIASSNMVGVQLHGKTIFVDKTSGSGLNGTLTKPFDTISTAFAAAVPDDIVRIVGNGGFDGDLNTLNDNYAYEIGYGPSGGPVTLTDGTSMAVPKGVTTMIDAGAVFKLRRARIGVGSSSAGVDRSQGSLQVLGTPAQNVYFTSWMDQSIGADLYAPTTSPKAGDWGGLVFRADVDNAEARANYEEEAIFLNYVNHADIRYGGGIVRIDTLDQTVSPIQMIETRPTVTFNTLTHNADTAMSADPDSFEETNFHAPRYQLVNEFTLDYERIGPEIHGNLLVDNSVNGLFVKIATPAGTELRELTVPGRFDDIDIVHVIAENLKIQGQSGEALLEQGRPPVDLVTYSTVAGGALPAGNYAYKLVFVDENGFEGRPSEATEVVNVAVPMSTIQLNNLPPVSGNFVSRRLYRQYDGAGSGYKLVAELDARDTSFVDDGSVSTVLDMDLLKRDVPSVASASLTPHNDGATGPGLAPGLYNYRVLTVAADGELSPASDATDNVLVDSPAVTGDYSYIDLAGLPPAPAGSVLQIYRSSIDGRAPYYQVAELAAGTTGYQDTGNLRLDGAGAPIELDPRLTGVVRARPDARLKIDPGMVVKLEGARIEVAFGAQLIAEGYDGQEVVFTSKLDDKYGAGGTFDTNGDGVAGVDASATVPSPGDWGGLYIGHLGELNLDHAYVAFGGGNNSKIEGTFKGFNVIELHQADARIAHSVIEQNANGTGGQGPNDRFGRGSNEAATIFIRGSQPVIAENIIRDNANVAIDINVDTFTGTMVEDPGRTTGTIGLLSGYSENQGPLIRGNQLANNGNVGSSVGVNGMKIRTAGVNSSGVLQNVGITLSTDSVWDDTDIVHILYDEVRVPDFHVLGGLRLESSQNESLVVKMAGAGAVNDAYNTNPTQGAGFTATGRPLEMEDRIGGVLHVVGQPGFPVVLTSIHDDTVGAGIQPDGTPQTDTNNNGWNSEPAPGDWRSVRLDQFSHDRNVELVLELESPEETAPGPNATVDTAQFLGDLAPSEYESDDGLRLGFEIHGFLNAGGDVDVYSFNAEAGTEVWFDFDRTDYALDTVIELLDANGLLIAQSDNSQWETAGETALYSGGTLAADQVNPLQKLSDAYQSHHASGVVKDYFGSNYRDAGMRVVLPGAYGASSAYVFRVRSSNLGYGDPASDLQDGSQLPQGLTSGVYQLQVRMRELDEVPGSVVRYADIRYAQNGIEILGHPAHSPLLGEAAEDEGTDQTLASNNSAVASVFIPGNKPQDLGNLFNSDRATQSIAGSLASAADIDFYEFDVTYDAISNSSAAHGSLSFDLDYADGLSRPDTTTVVFWDDPVRGLTPVLIGRDSNIAEDRPAPVVDTDDQSGMHDLARGSVGELDPFIGPAQVPQGRYLVAVVSDQLLPDALSDPGTRLEPIDSLVRIAEDHIGSYGGSTALPPLVPVLLDPNFDGTDFSPTNLWHVSEIVASEPGHGLTPAFDGSRLGVTAGGVSEQEDNDTIATAQSLEGGLVWSLDYDADIGDYFGNTSTSIPHIKITSDPNDNNDTFDYYSFNVSTVPATVILDIDYGDITPFPALPVPGDVDADIALFDAAGTLIDWDWSSPTSWGAGGSVASEDAYIQTVITRPGTYVVGVGSWPTTPSSGGLSGNPVPSGSSYVLNVSVENHAAVTTVGSGGKTFYFGVDATAGYNLGAGQVPSGSLWSNAFSLEDYSAADKPVLYYTYKQDTDPNDHFRVYVNYDPDGDGTPEDVLVASSNPADIRGNIQRLTNDAVWRQTRIELDDFAGFSGLRLRFQFEAADDVTGAVEGVHIDDLVIGFAERGEMITNAPAETTFSAIAGYNAVGKKLNGEYQLEIRKATEYGTSVDARVGFRAVDGLILNTAFDTNDRQAQQMTVIAPAGTELRDGQTFRLGDGSGSLTFEFDSGGGISSGGYVRVPFQTSFAAHQVAAAIRDAINSPSVQTQLDLQAALSDGTASGTAGRSNLVNIFGNAVGEFDIVADDVLEILENQTTDSTEFAARLRDEILGPGLRPVAGDMPAFTGGQSAVDNSFTSAGRFVGGRSSIGMASGIVLTTGNVELAAGPNDLDDGWGVASNAGDADLSAEFGLTTRDTSSLEFQFEMDAAADVFFNFVFASEEYNELADLIDADVLAVFIDGTNVALLPDGVTPVSTHTVHGGNPLGSTSSNGLYYNNNDPSDGGEYLQRLGYDGFTDVLTARATLGAGTHTIKIAISDVGLDALGNPVGDSAVFIQTGSLGIVDPAPPSPAPLKIIQHDGFGDSNLFRDQGQILIHSNTITDSADFAIVSDSGERDYSRSPDMRWNQPHMGAVRNLRELNNRTNSGVQGGFAPGLSIVNNTIAGEGLGGIHFSGNLRPYELVMPRPEDYPTQNTAFITSADSVCDGDSFSVTVGRTTVVFEFEDIARSPENGPQYTCPVGGAGANVGVTPGRIPVFYRRTVPTRVGDSQQQMAANVAAAIASSILIANDTTLVGDVINTNSQWGRLTIDPNSGFPVPSVDWSVFIEHARDVSVGPTHGASHLFEIERVLSIGHAAQPFGRIVNNTIYGGDGNDAMFPENAGQEPNDTIFNAVNTKQGRAASPAMYSASNVVLGNTVNFPQDLSRDVDFFQYQLDVGDRVAIDVTGNNFIPEVRVFNSVGQEMPYVTVNAQRGEALKTVTGTAVSINFYAAEGDTYFVAVSGEGNADYSPLSLGNRQSATVGRYDITVDVSAPRTWVFDTEPLANGTGTYEVYDVDGRSITVNAGGGGTTAGAVGQISGAINGAVGSGQLNGEISTRTYGGNAARYVVVEGAAKILVVSGSGNSIAPYLTSGGASLSNENGLLRETGILISEASTPTLLNNVIANTRSAIVETENQPAGHQASGASPRTAVVGATMFQHSQPINSFQAGAAISYGNWQISTTGQINPEERLTARPVNADFNIVAANTGQLFDNPAAGNFFPAEMAALIDSSVNSLEDRPQFIFVKEPMGIANSPILAPDRDGTGQLRVDDPTVAPPQGQGANVFKDRGSLDRSDFVGPAAVLLNPRDNDADGTDIDPTQTVVHLEDGTYADFQIQIVDGFEAADPFPGVGVNDDTVYGPKELGLVLPGAAVTIFEDGRFLQESIDYTFAYDTTRNVIYLAPTAGVWPDDKVYVVRLNNRDRYVISAPEGSLDLDGAKFRITDAEGIDVTFEFDGGYNIQVPQSLTVQVPEAGGGTGGVADSERFIIRDTNNPLNPPVTFEFDTNGFVQGSNIPVGITLNSTQDEVAQAIVDALHFATALPLTDPRHLELGLARKLAGGVVHLAAPTGYTLRTDLASLQQAPTIQALSVPALSSLQPDVADVAEGQQFSVTQGANTVVFEFDSDLVVGPGATRVALPAARDIDGVSNAILLALQGAALLNLTDAQYLGHGLVHVDAANSVAIDALSSALIPGNVARNIVDGENFEVRFDDDANLATAELVETFEFDTDGSSSGFDYVIPVSLADTHEEIGEKIALAVRAAENLELAAAKHLDDGLVYLGGTPQHTLNLAASPSLDPPRGIPDVSTSTTLQLPSTPTILVPPNGGAGVADGETIVIGDGTQTLIFEFHDNDLGPVNVPPPRKAIPYSSSNDDAAALALKIQTAISGVVPSLAGIVPQVVTVDGVTGYDVGVELTGFDGTHSLDTTGAANVYRKGGRVLDGESFTISFDGVSVTFEFDDNNSRTLQTNKAILFSATDTLDDIANNVIRAIQSTPGLGLNNLVYAGDGGILMNDTSRHSYTFPPDGINAPVDLSVPSDLPLGAVVTTGIPGGSIALPFEPWAGFTGADMAEVIVAAINGGTALSGVTSAMRGDNTLFVDFLDANNDPADFVGGLANVSPGLNAANIESFFLRAIQDMPGNWLKPNQFNNQTQFTILMPGANLDFGDAQADANKAFQYPTLFDDNGARHVITAAGPRLGAFVDRETEAQTAPAGFGDDVDHWIDLLLDQPDVRSPLSVLGDSPFTVLAPETVAPGDSFTITDHTVNPAFTVTFIFDDPASPTVTETIDQKPVWFVGSDRVAVAEAIVAAVGSANLGLDPAHLGSGAVHIGGSPMQVIDGMQSEVSTQGFPAYRLTAPALPAIADGDLFSINDGVYRVNQAGPIAKVFEFDTDGVSVPGNIRVDVSPSQVDPFLTLEESAEAVAAQIKTAIDSQFSATMTVTPLGKGALHIQGPASHTIGDTLSLFSEPGYVPVELQAAAAGLGFTLTPGLSIEVENFIAGGLTDGQSFLIGDGQNTVKFEINTIGGLQDGDAVEVAISSTDLPEIVADSIRDAINAAVVRGDLIGLAASNSANPLQVDLGAGLLHTLDTSASALKQAGAVNDGEWVTVDGVEFEFDFDSPTNVQAGRKAVAVNPADSANDIANKLVAEIQQAVIDGDLTTPVRPKNLTGGSIQIGGLAISSNTASMAETGAQGGVLDGQRFDLRTGDEVLRFEFDADGLATPGNIRVAFNSGSTAEDVADEIVAKIRQSGFDVSIDHLGGGIIRLDGDDEDGVRFDGEFTPGSPVPLTVNAVGDGFLDVWVDFNSDGDWNDPLEHTLQSVPLVNGQNREILLNGQWVPLQIDVPVWAGIGETYARFRYSSQGGLAPTGLAIDGEVEDYRILVISNDAPQITAPTDVTTDEDISVTISGVDLSDADAGSSTVYVTLRVEHGALTLDTTIAGGINQFNIVSPAGTATAQELLIAARLSELNTTLKSLHGLTYLNTLDHNGLDVLTIIVDDDGHTGTGGRRFDISTTTIHITPVNDVPVFPGLPGLQTGVEDTPLTITGIQVDDVEISDGQGAGQIEVKLEVTSGVLSVNDSLLDPTTGVTGNGTATVTLFGDLADVQDTLALGVVYQGNQDHNGNDTLTLTANDQGDWPATDSNGDPTIGIGTATIPISLAADNDAPVVTVPTTGIAPLPPNSVIVLEDSNSPLSGFDLADVDSAASPVTVSLSVSGRNDNGTPNGTLTILDTSSLSFVTPSPVNNTVTNDMITVVAPVDAISALLKNTAAWYYTPPLNFAGDSAVSGREAYEILTVTAWDGGATGDESPVEVESDSQSVTVFVNEKNDPPVVTAPDVVTVAEDTPITLNDESNVHVTDVEVAASTLVPAPEVRVTVTATRGGVRIGNSGSFVPSLTLQKNLTDLNADLDLLQFQGNANVNSADATGALSQTATVVITADDRGVAPAPARTTSHTITITVTPVNDAPVLTLPASYSTIEDANYHLTGIAVADVDVAEGTGSGLLTLTLSVAAVNTTPAGADGTLSVVSLPSGGPQINKLSDQSYELIGTPQQINAVLSDATGVTYHAAQDAYGAVQLTAEVTDNGNYPGPTPVVVTESVTITVAADNDAPQIVLPATLPPLDEDDPNGLTINGISFSDVDAGGADVQMTLTVSDGVLTVDATHVESGNGSNQVVLKGSIAELNTTLGSAIHYLPNQHANGPDVLTVSVDDLGNGPSPSQPNRIATSSLTINVTAINDPPAVSAPTTATVMEDSLTGVNISPITVSDVDVAEDPQGTGKLTVTLTVPQGSGRLLVNQGIANGVSSVTGNNTATVTFSAFPAQINATLSSPTGLKFIPAAEFSGAVNLVVSMDDAGQTGDDRDGTVGVKTVAINVVAVNDAPTITLPAAQSVNEDVTTLLAFPSNTIADADAGTNNIQVTLQATRGEIAVNDLGQLPGLEYQDNHRRVVMTGPISAINQTLLRGVTYSTLGTDFENNNGPETITIAADDQGFTGDPNNVQPKTATATYSFTVAAVNDPPVLTAPTGTVQINEDERYYLTSADFAVLDADAHETTTGQYAGMVKLTLSAAAGTVHVDTNIAGGLGAANVESNGSTFVTLRATPDQINTTLANGQGIWFIGSPTNYNGGASLGLRLTDRFIEANPQQINTGPVAGGTVDATANIPITIQAVNDPPQLTLVGPTDLDEDAKTPVTMQVTDVELASSAIWTVTLASSHGTFDVAAVAGGVSNIVVGQGLVTLTGTGSQVKTTLETAGAVQFTPALNRTADGTFSVTIVDGGALPGDASDDVTVSQTLTFSINAKNDAPAITLPQGVQVNEDAAAGVYLSGTAMSLVDVDSDANNITVVLEVQNGKLSLSTAHGLTAGQITGNNTKRVTIVAPQSAVGTTFAAAQGVRYNPNAEYSGNDVLTVTANDGGFSGDGGMKTTVVSTTITVNPVNDAPVDVAPIENVVVNEDAPDTVIELYPGVFFDKDDTVQSLAIRLLDPANNRVQTLTINDNVSGLPLINAKIQGTQLTLDYIANRSGTATVRVQAADDDGALSPVVSFTVTVNPVPDGPYVANPLSDITMLKQGSDWLLNVPLANVFADDDTGNGDPAGDTLTLSYNNATDNTNTGLIIDGDIGGNNILTLVVKGNAVGTAQLTVRATDRAGATVSDTFVVTINSEPVAGDDTAATFEDTAVTIPVFLNDTDPDGTINRNTIQIVGGSKTPHGTIVAINDGVITYQPDANYFSRKLNGDVIPGAADTFQYTIKDNSGFVSNVATVTVTIQEVPDYQNSLLNEDVNGSDQVSPIDVLHVINYINAHGATLPADPVSPDVPQTFWDVNGDGVVSALDVLRVINEINRRAAQGAQPEAEPADMIAASEPLLAVPSYSLAVRAPEPLSKTAAEVAPQATAAADDLDAFRTAEIDPFQAIGEDASELFDMAMNDLLGDIADDVDRAQGDQLDSDWVLSGLQPRA